MVFCNNFYQRKRLGRFLSTGKPRAKTRVAVSALRACVPGHSLRQSPSTQVLRSCHTHPRESGWVIFCARKLARLRTIPPYKSPSSPQPACLVAAVGALRSSATGTCGQKALATLAPFPRMTPPRFRYAAPTSATPDHPPL